MSHVSCTYLEEITAHDGNVTYHLWGPGLYITLLIQMYWHVPVIL